MEDRTSPTPSARAVSAPGGTAASNGPSAERPTAPRWAAAIGTAVLFPMGPGLVVVLVPWLITRWQTGVPAYPAAVRGVGVALLVAGALIMISTFVRFPVEGAGMPSPVQPTSARVIVGGLYRYVRNPMYVAYAPAIAGLALLLSRPVLLIYAAALLAALAVVVHWLEQPALVRRFGADYDAYRAQVRAWWPRLPRRAP